MLLLTRFLQLSPVVLRCVNNCLCIGLVLTVVGCESQPKGGAVGGVASIVELNTLYDYQLVDHDLKALDLAQVVRELQDADVVFIGEFHGNQASHLLQMKMLAGLHFENRKAGRETVLSLEMFNRDQQAILDDYLSNKIGERYLMEETPTWKNYAGSYRPLIEYAKQHELSVVAANAAADAIRCIGRFGESYLDRLAVKERQFLALNPFIDIADYEEKFFGLMGSSGHMPKNAMRRSYLAQLARDNTMAESIDKALKKQPGAQVVHLNGSFHSEGHLGTVGAFQKRQPALKLVVITPVRREDVPSLQSAERQDDYYYVINPQPLEFVNPEYRKTVHREMFKASREKAESCNP